MQHQFRAAQINRKLDFQNNSIGLPNLTVSDVTYHFAYNPSEVTGESIQLNDMNS